jgi:hypothetical protein
MEQFRREHSATIESLWARSKLDAMTYASVSQGEATSDRQLKKHDVDRSTYCSRDRSFHFLKGIQFSALGLDVGHRVDKDETRFLRECRNLVARRRSVANPWKDQRLIRRVDESSNPRSGDFRQSVVNPWRNSIWPMDLD